MSRLTAAGQTDGTVLPQPPPRWFPKHSSSLSRLQVGAGAREVLDVPGPGAVVAVYRRAAYLRLPGGIVALVTSGVAPGPLWIRADGFLGADIAFHDPATSGKKWSVHLHDPVTIGDRCLEVAGRRLPVGRAETWRGPLPDPARLRAAAPFAVDVLAGAPRSSLLDDPWRTALRRAEAAVGGGDLPGAAAVLGGLGPGLTPSGDDALAGILLAHRALAGAAAEPHLLAAARSAVTTDLSAALTAWAARGQSVAPVHDLLAAVTEGDRTAAVTAIAGIASLGASSGADLLLGLRLGLQSAATAKVDGPAVGSAHGHHHPHRHRRHPGRAGQGSPAAMHRRRLPGQLPPGDGKGRENPAFRLDY